MSTYIILYNNFKTIKKTTLFQNDFKIKPKVTSEVSIKLMNLIRVNLSIYLLIHDKPIMVI